MRSFSLMAIFEIFGGTAPEGDETSSQSASFDFEQDVEGGIKIEWCRRFGREGASCDIMPTISSYKMFRK